MSEITSQFAAEYTLLSPPNAQSNDELRFLDLRVSNTGSAAWPHQGNNPITLSYRWRDNNGRLLPGEGPHIRLSASLEPGQSATLELPIHTPARAGFYTLEIQLIQEGVAWFDELGVAPLQQPFQVLEASTSGRVVCLINSSCRTRDAIGQHIVEQIRFFKARGDRVLAIVEDIDERWPREVRQHLVSCDLETLRSGQPSLAQRRAYEHFASADLVIVHYSAYYPLAEAIRIINRGQVIFDYHGVTPASIWSGIQGGEELAAGERNLRLARYADFAIAHSSYARDELIRGSGISAERIHLMPYVVPLDAFKPGPRDPDLIEKYGLEGKSVLLYIGRMAANKRVIDLVRALPLIQRAHPNTVLLLVGDTTTPPYPQLVAEAKQAAEELGVSKDVIFTGQVDKLPAYYQLCDLFVTASVHEGFCIPVIEAEASGKPVVGSDATALPETIGPGGLTFPAYNVEALAEQVIHLLNSRTVQPSPA
jgi:Glycosyltransferase